MPNKIVVAFLATFAAQAVRVEEMNYVAQAAECGDNHLLNEWFLPAPTSNLQVVSHAH